MSFISHQVQAMRAPCSPVRASFQRWIGKAIIFPTPLVRHFSAALGPSESCAPISALEGVNLGPHFGGAGSERETSGVSVSDGDARLRTTTSRNSRNHRLRNPNAPPFFVKRTAAGNLPIYVFRRNNKSLALTVIRKVRGDVGEFKKQLEVVTRGARVKISESEGIEINGDFKNVVRNYLEGCGN